MKRRLFAAILCLALLASCGPAGPEETSPAPTHGSGEARPTVQPVEVVPPPDDLPEEPPVTPAPEGTPAPEETPLPEATPAPEETPLPEATPAPEETPLPEATPAPEETPPPEEPPIPEETPLPESEWVAFVPPNRQDMTIFDTSAVVHAWEIGDETGLTEQELTILRRCREVLAQCVTGDMTPFQKELAIHDWLTGWGEFDHAVYDPATPQGRPHNSDPYGMLTEGYGVGLGYASTFQLLLELCGVECTIVVGAVNASTTDHAWNMVRLDGAWYCVDATRDDTAGDWYPAYDYFNVSSDYMRKTDHQWDYGNVPEATATRFHWSGYGAKPE